MSVQQLLCSIICCSVALLLFYTRTFEKAIPKPTVFRYFLFRICISFLNRFFIYLVIPTSDPHHLVLAFFAVSVQAGSLKSVVGIVHKN